MAAIRKFDVIVIGGGSGGSGEPPFNANLLPSTSPHLVSLFAGFAKRAAGYGKKVCIIEKGAVYDEHGSRRGAGYGATYASRRFLRPAQSRVMAPLLRPNPLAVALCPWNS